MEGREMKRIASTEFGRGEGSSCKMHKECIIEGSYKEGSGTRE